MQQRSCALHSLPRAEVVLGRAGAACCKCKRLQQAFRRAISENSRRLYKRRATRLLRQHKATLAMEQLPIHWRNYRWASSRLPTLSTTAAHFNTKTNPSPPSPRRPPFDPPSELAHKGDRSLVQRRPRLVRHQRSGRHHLTAGTPGSVASSRASRLLNSACTARPVGAGGHLQAAGGGAGGA